MDKKYVLEKILELTFRFCISYIQQSEKIHVGRYNCIVLIKQRLTIIQITVDLQSNSETTRLNIILNYSTPNNKSRLNTCHWSSNINVYVNVYIRLIQLTKLTHFNVKQINQN